jgi:hypothetical protein
MFPHGRRRHHHGRRHHHHHHHHNRGLGVGLGLLAGATMGMGRRSRWRNQGYPQQRTIIVQQPAPVIVQQQQLPVVPPGHQLMAVQCPPNVYGGQLLNITTPNGMMQITVPPGISPGQRFQVLVPLPINPTPIQATSVRPPHSYQPPAPIQQTAPPPPPSYQHVPDRLIRSMVRNGLEYLEIRNAVKQTMAPTVLTQEHKQAIRQTIATEHNQMRLEQQSLVPQAPVPQAQVVQPAVALKPVAKQLLEFGYDYHTCVAAADRCSTVESAMDWISHHSPASASVTDVGGGAESTNIGREGRRSFSDAMSMPTAPPLY